MNGISSVDAKAEEKKIRVVLCAIGTVIVIAAFVWGYWVGQPGGWFSDANHKEMRDVMAARGAWGDSFAPFAVLLNGAAIIMAIWSVTLQRIELKAALEEMRTQSGEQKRANDLQKQAIEAQERSTHATLRMYQLQLSQAHAKSTSNYKFHLKRLRSTHLTDEQREHHQDEMEREKLLGGILAEGVDDARRLLWQQDYATRPKKDKAGPRKAKNSTDPPPSA